MESSENSSPYPTATEVFEEIGEKPTAAFFRSVMNAKADLRVYRQAFPQFVLDASERGLANWIHDRVWAHLAALADGIPGMDVYESGPTREIVIGINHRFRVKRHDELGNVASYPTDSFLVFVCQPATQLPGMEESRLIAGYTWLKDLRDIGEPVVSLRDGTDNVIWFEPLPVVDEGGETGIAPVVVPEQSGPTTPTVEIPDAIVPERGDKSEGG